MEMDMDMENRIKKEKMLIFFWAVSVSDCLTMIFQSPNTIRKIPKVPPANKLSTTKFSHDSV